MTQASRRVSPKTIEETYTDNDVERAITPDQYGLRPFTSYNTSIGFQFDYPMRWLNDKSDYKAIGIRRLKIIPTTHTFDFTINVLVSWYEIQIEEVTSSDTVTEYKVTYNICDMNRYPTKYNDYIKVHIDQKILHDNSLNEVLTSITNQLNDRLYGQSVYCHWWAVPCHVTPDKFNMENLINNPFCYLTDEYFSGGGSYTYAQVAKLPNTIRFNYDYDNATGNLKFNLIYTGGDNLNGIFNEQTTLNLPATSNSKTLTETLIKPCSFYISNPTKILNNINLISFLKFLNQPVSEQTLTYITTKNPGWSFTNVWDREIVQVHASFSDNNRSFIGLNGDFYEKPSVLYEPPTNASNFSVYFTTDGHHRILLLYCRFFIGLCFIRNYNTSLATK